MDLVERGGSARSFQVDGVRIADLQPAIRENLSRETTMNTDEGSAYKVSGSEFAKYGTVARSQDEYVRGDTHTNTVEGFYSIFKRGMKGVYQHCKEKHLHRYLCEFDFRYCIALGVDDVARAERALKGRWEAPNLSND